MIDYRLLGVLLLMGVLPTLYRTVRIHFLGDLPVDWGYNIASQLTWLSVTYEVVHEALMLPMFFLIGRFIHDDTSFSRVVSNGLLLIGALYASLSLLTIAFADPMVRFMAQKDDLVSATVTYIRIEAVGLTIAAFARYLTLVLITIKEDRRLLVLLAIQMGLSVLLDTFLVSSLPFSLHLGVNGIAFTNILVNAVLVTVSLLMLLGCGVRPFGPGFRIDWSWLGDWFKVGGLSGLESFVRNAAFVLMVVRLVNVVQQQGTFWVMNNFIWGWLLFPILALGDLVKRDTAANEDAVLTRTPAYVFLTAGVVGIWFLTIPAWQWFVSTVMGVPNPGIVFRLALISLAFYVVFAFNNIADSVFYGRGRTDLMLYQSLIVNLLFYGGAYILYRAGIYSPTLTKITVMFGAGIAFDSAITFVMFARFRRKLVRA